MQSKVRRGVAVSAVLAAGIIGGLTAGGGVGSAMPGGCQSLVSPSGKATSTHCSTGSGQFQAVAVCRDAERGTTVYRYGVWTSPGRQSIAYCQGVEYASDAGVNLKN